MLTVTDIGTLVSYDLERDRRPMIAGTQTSVRRIVALYQQNTSAEAIARRLSHLSLAQVYAALAYYHANREQIDEEMAIEEAEYNRLAALYRH